MTVELYVADAVLFDNDGVLVDSTTAGEAAWSEWAVAHGLEPEVVLAGIHGRRSRETVARFLPADEVESATAAVDALELAAADRTRAIPGAAELLSSIPDDVRAVVTSGSRPLLAARLGAAGIPVPSVLVTAEDVTAGKPAPEPYLLGAARLGADIARCLVLEDSPTGITAARAAGAGTVVGVGRHARGHGCDVVVDDLRDLRWTGTGLEVLRSIEHRGPAQRSS